MNQEGFVRVGAAVPRVNPADCDANAESIIELCHEVAAQGVRLVAFPELAITGYTCGDLLLQDTLLEGARRSLDHIAVETARLPLVAVVGVPMRVEGVLCNCAAVISGGKVHALVTKTYLPNYGEFYEKRWFHALLHPNSTLFELDGFRFGVEICEDLWAPIPPSRHLSLAGAEAIVNLSASNSLVSKRKALTRLIVAESASQHCAYVYCSSGYGESTTDCVFDGKAIIADNGFLQADSERWQRKSFFEMADIDIELIKSERNANGTFCDCAQRENATNSFEIIDVTPKTPALVSDDFIRRVDSRPFVPSNPAVLAENCDEIASIQALGLARRMEATGCKSLTIGISGGLDSTLALLIAVKTFDMLGLDRKNIIAVTMPGFGTSGRTKNNADALMRHLGVTVREIPIGPAVIQHFKDIDHDPQQRDVTYENAQARMRTLILMDIANKTGGMVLGTGDLSELALGWATYNGDHMSMYGINAGVPKTAVREVVNRFAQLDPDLAPTLRDIIETPVSPELLPADENGEIAQVTEDHVGPYELHDFFLYHLVRFRRRPKKIYLLACKAFEGEYEPQVIAKWLKTFIRRFFTQQFKRSCLPDGPKVGTVGISPRGDWRMPSDASSTLWLREAEELI